MMDFMDNEKNEVSCFDSIDHIMNWDYAEKYVYPRLISEEQYEKMDGVISCPFLDLKTIFVLTKHDKHKGSISIKITEDMLAHYHIDIDTLMMVAIENMRKSGYHFENLDKMIARMMGVDSSVECEGNISDINSGMYVISTNIGVYGAASILDSENLRKLLGNTDGYLLPSSTHEWLFVAASEFEDVNYLKEMIEMVNNTVVSEEDRLSYHPYYYKACENRVECA